MTPRQFAGYLFWFAICTWAVPLFANTAIFAWRMNTSVSGVCAVVLSAAVVFATYLATTCFRDLWIESSVLHPTYRMTP